MQFILSSGKKEIAYRLNFTYRFVHKHPDLENYLGQMYLVGLEIKDVTEINPPASYLVLLLSILRDGKLHNSINNKI